MCVPPPIFIVGSPRSGTTLLRNMLNRHPAIAICHETYFHHLVYRRRHAFGNLNNLGNRRRLVEEYLSTERVTSMGIDLQALEETLLREGTSYETFFASLLRFYAQANSKRRCGEKSPRHAVFTETLCQWFPGAFIIHILRDPRDVVASLLRMPWASRSVLTNSDTWLRCNLGAWRSRQRPGYLQVRYEELATRPEEELRRICAFVGEEYTPVMLTPSPDRSQHLPWFQRAQEAVTTARLGKWRVQLTAGQIALIEWKVGPHLRTFGYEPGAPGAPSGFRIARELLASLFDVVRREVGAFPAGWYYHTRSASINKEEAARHRFQRRQLNYVDP